jgi:hypothetical protein
VESESTFWLMIRVLIWSSGGESGRSARRRETVTDVTEGDKSRYRNVERGREWEEDRVGAPYRGEDAAEDEAENCMAVYEGHVMIVMGVVHHGGR